MTQLFAFLFATVLSLVLAPFVIWIYKKYNWLDDPKKSSHPKIVHTSPLPRGGGLVVSLAILICIAVFLPLYAKLAGVIVGAVILTLMGVWDDIADPPPFFRLALQVVAAGCVAVSGIGVYYITNPFGGVIHFDSFLLQVGALSIPIITILVTLIWIVWCMNIVNFSTGLDGQMPGYVVIAALTIGMLSRRFIADPNEQSVLILSLIVAGAYVGFLFWNMYPQKMMSGFGASTLAGFFLAILSILSGAKLATAIMVLAVPMADALFVIFRRLKNKRSPFYGDRGHLHHALLDSGLSKRQVALVYWLAAAILGILSLSLSSEQKLFAILLIGSIVCMIAIWLRLFFIQFGKSVRDNG